MTNNQTYRPFNHTNLSIFLLFCLISEASGLIDQAHHTQSNVPQSNVLQSNALPKCATPCAVSCGDLERRPFLHEVGLLRVSFAQCEQACKSLCGETHEPLSAQDATPIKPGVISRFTSGPKPVEDFLIDWREARRGVEWVEWLDFYLTRTYDALKYFLSGLNGQASPRIEGSHGLKAPQNTQIQPIEQFQLQSQLSDTSSSTDNPLTSSPASSHFPSQTPPNFWKTLLSPKAQHAPAPPPQILQRIDLPDMPAL